MAKHKIVKSTDKSEEAKIASEPRDILLHAFGGGLHKLGATHEEARLLDGTDELEHKAAMDAAAKRAIDAINKDAEKEREMRRISPM